MKIELSDQAVEDVVCASIKEHMKYCKKNIKELKKKDKLKDFEQEDLSYNQQMYEALDRVYGYFGGHL